MITPELVLTSVIEWFPVRQRAEDLIDFVLDERPAVKALIATQRGSADELLATMLADGWTLADEVDYAAGKRIRYLLPPASGTAVTS